MGVSFNLQNQTIFSEEEIIANLPKFYSKFSSFVLKLFKELPHKILKTTFSFFTVTSYRPHFLQTIQAAIIFFFFALKIKKKIELKIFVDLWSLLSSTVNPNYHNFHFFFNSIFPSTCRILLPNTLWVLHFISWCFFFFFLPCKVCILEGFLQEMILTWKQKFLLCFCFHFVELR